VEALSLQIAEPAIRDVLAPVLDGIEIQTEPRLDDGTVALNPFWADERLDMGRTVIEALAEAVPTVALREKLGALLRDTHFAYSYGYSLGWYPEYPLAVAAYNTLLRWAEAGESQRV
jgi:hypothetical protein